VKAGDPAVTVRVTVLLSISPPASTTIAVMVCVPGASVLVLNEPPLPISPSRLDTQLTFEAMLPPRSSVAVALNVTGVPLLTLARQPVR
jgi:hypothetical protein